MNSATLETNIEEKQEKVVQQSNKPNELPMLRFPCFANELPMLRFFAPNAGNEGYFFFQRQFKVIKII